MITPEDIEAGKSPAGGFTKAQLAEWGVPWPPPKKWQEKLIRGESFDKAEIVTPSPVRPNADARDLLRQVVVAVVNAGHAEDLHRFPDVLAYFGCKYPAKSTYNDSGWKKRT